MDTVPSNSMRARDSPPGWPRTSPPSSHVQPGPHETGVWIHQLIPLRFLTAIITPLYQPTHTARTRRLPGSALRVPFHSNSQDPGKRTTRNHCGRNPVGLKRGTVFLGWLSWVGGLLLHCSFFFHGGRLFLPGVTFFRVSVHVALWRGERNDTAGGKSLLPGPAWETQG